MEKVILLSLIFATGFCALADDAEPLSPPRFSCPEEDVSFGSGNSNDDLINELYDVYSWEDCGTVLERDRSLRGG